MTIRYTLYENKMREEGSIYAARVQPIRSIDIDGVIDRMMQHGSTITRADVLGVLENYQVAVTQLLLEGNAVITPLVNYGASIRGVFDDLDDGYEASRHEVRPATTPGKYLRDAIAQRATVEKRETARVTPVPIAYVDFNSGERNNTLTPGGMGKLTGHRLKYNPDYPDQGIYLVDSSGLETRVDVVGQNYPSSLVFMVPPALAPDSYRIEVRASFNGNGDLRSGALRTLLHVA